MKVNHTQLKCSHGLGLRVRVSSFTLCFINMQGQTLFSQWVIIGEAIG